MNLIFALLRESRWLAGGLILVALVLMREVGYWLGRHHRARDSGEREGVGLVVGAMLGLMAFVLALSLNVAHTRFEERRTATLAEANAIGTAILRARATGEAHGARIAELVQEYGKARLEFVQASSDRRVLAAIEQRTAELQEDIWAQMSALVQARTDPLTTSLMAALNETFDAATAERFTHVAPLAARLFWLLAVMTLLSAVGLGYQLGLRGTSIRPLSVLLTVMWTILILEIFDLGAPRDGAIRTAAVAYEWALSPVPVRPGAPPSPSNPR